MPRVTLPTGIELEYETFGSDNDPTLLLVMGLGAQLIHWDTGFCELLAAEGYRVVRYDNRDAGLSTHLDGQAADPMAVMAAIVERWAGPRGRVPPVRHGRRRDRPARPPRRRPGPHRRRLDGRDDRADDGDRAPRPGRLDGVGDEHAGRPVGRPADPGGDGGAAQDPTGRSRRVHRGVGRRRGLRLEEVRRSSSACVSSRRWRSTARSTPRVRRASWPAIWASGDRSEQLREVRVPTLVIHGRDDTLITLSGAERTAELIPGADLLVLADMGHDLPEPLWPKIVSAISQPHHHVGGRRRHGLNGDNAMAGPLNGVRIIELAGIGPGPFAAMLLADMGAEVIRVERAQAVRGPAPDAPSSDVLLRGRRNVAIDLKHPDGAATLLDLVEGADALIEGFRPGVTERLGIGPDECLARNPRLVYGRMTGWGQDGPLAHASGHDINYISLAGALAHFRRAGSPPVPPLNMVGDFGGGGMFLAFGVVCGLLEASRSGAGQVVDAAMVDGTAVLMSMFWAFRSTPLFDEHAPGTNLLDTGAHFYDVYECSDGVFISVGSIEPQFYAELLRLTGLVRRRAVRGAERQVTVAGPQGAHRRTVQDPHPRRVV